MTRRYAIATMLLLAGLTIIANAAGAAATDTIAAVASKRAPRATAAARSTPTPRATAGARSQPAAALRRLETTHIEGDIPVPQVLFITARDQRRFMDFHHQRYLKTSRQLAEATPTPTWITVTRSEPREPSP